jgi:hypothetical protein
MTSPKLFHDDDVAKAGDDKWRLVIGQMLQAWTNTLWARGI